MAANQVFVRLLDGRTQCLQIPTAAVSGATLKRYLFLRTGIPLPLQRLVSGRREIHDETLISASEDGVFPSCNLLLRLRGGKGGFGSLLRGAATKAGQKKTNNFDACRDMSGRRLRHVNAEKRLEEWKAEADERRLEKLAEQFLKKKAKEVKKDPSVAVQKYVEKYRKDSAKCMEEVEESVRQSFALYEKSKRKVLPSSGPASKRLKTWLGKQKVDESESEDDDEDEDDADKSVVLDDGNQQEEGEGILGSTSGSQSDPESSDGVSGQSNLEEEKGSSSQRCLDVEEGSGNVNTSSNSDGSAESKREHCEEKTACVEAASNLVSELDSCEVHAVERDVGPELVSHEQANVESKIVSCPEELLASTEENVDSPTAVKDQAVDHKEAVTQCFGTAMLEEQLNFEKFNSAEDMEVRSLGQRKMREEMCTVSVSVMKLNNPHVTCLQYQS